VIDVAGGILTGNHFGDGAATDGVVNVGDVEST
jgi:hypothetical protein